MSPWKLFGWFRRPQLGATGDWQLHHTMHLLLHHILCRVFDKRANHPGDSAPLPPRFGVLALLPFPKLKSPLKGKRFQTIDETQENRMGKLMAFGRTVWGPKVSTLKGTEAALSYVHCFFYLVSSSVTVSIFRITWLDTFCTDLVYHWDFCHYLLFSNRHTLMSNRCLFELKPWNSSNLWCCPIYLLFLGFICLKWKVRMTILSLNNLVNRKPFWKY